MNADQIISTIAHVRLNIENGVSFSAHDVTKLVRMQFPTDNIYHVEVRELIHALYRNKFLTECDRSDTGSYILYIPKNATADTILTQPVSMPPQVPTFISSGAIPINNPGSTGASSFIGNLPTINSTIENKIINYINLKVFKKQAITLKGIQGCLRNYQVSMDSIKTFVESKGYKVAAANRKSDSLVLTNV